MSEDNIIHSEHNVPKKWYRHELAIFIAGSVVVAFGLVMVSLALYVSSGAAQLDLSRPGYQSVQSKLDQTDNFESFPATGPVTADSLDQFQHLYQKQTKPVDNADIFSGTALDDQVLGIDAPNAGDANATNSN